MSFGQAKDISGEFDHRALHAQADAKEGDAFLAGMANGGQLAIDATRSKAGCHQNAMQSGEALCHIFRGDLFTVNPIHFHLGFKECACMVQGLGDAFVAVFQLNVLADQANAHVALGIFVTPQEVFPLVKVGFGDATIHAEFPQHHFVKPFLLHQEWYVVDGVGIDALDDGVEGHVAETGKFGADRGGKGVFCAADEHIGLHPKLKQLFDRVLGGFGFQFTCGTQVRHQGEVHDEGVFWGLPLHLAHRLDVGK